MENFKHLPEHIYQNPFASELLSRLSALQGSIAKTRLFNQA